MGGVRIVAIGGGGCTNHADPVLDRWILSLAGRTMPNVGYLGTASGDDPRKIAGFRAAFAGRAAIAPMLPARASASDCANWLDGLDLVYVGGGNLLTLLHAWQVNQWSEPLKAAAHNGLLIVGVSAGAMCWFAQGFSRAGSDRYRALEGLGLIPGSCCPHFSDEPERQPAFAAALSNRTIEPGIAIDDGVAVLCDEAGARAYFSARSGHAAYRFSGGTEAIARETLPIWRSEG
jgi:peptidase E